MKKFYDLKTDVDHELVLYTAVFLALINIVLFAYFAASNWPVVLAVAIAVAGDVGFVRYATKRGFFYKAGLNAMGAEDQAESKEDQS